MFSIPLPRTIKNLIVLLRSLGLNRVLTGWALVNVALLPLCAATPPTDHAIWQVGMAQSLITPAQPIMLAGFASRREPFTGVVQDVYAKALALTDAKGNRAVLITCDFIGFRAVTADPICEAIMAETGLTRAQILINSSHTHTGPSQAHSPTTPSYLKPAYVRDLYDYTQWLQTRIVQTAVAALNSPQPARLSQTTGVASFVMNRREPSARGIILGHNPRGPADRSLPVLKVDNLDGSLRALVFGVACHNTTILAQENEVCGDFAGFAQAQLEADHPGAQAMFMQGCGGDAGPYPTGKLAYARDHGRTLAHEIERLLKEENFTPIHGPLRTEFAYADLPLALPKSLSEIEAMQQGRSQWQRWAGTLLKQRHESGEAGPQSYAAPFAVWQFGDDLTLVGLSGEVVVDYVAMLERSLGPLNLWISGYCNDVFGYLPSARVLREGGYETRGLYGGDQFAPEVETVVVDHLREMAIRAGRTVPTLP